MWRITRLKLVNNAFIYSGTGKHEIDLDFNKANKNSKINLLMGKIGTGKTALLSQLQPFASVGTLDTRNTEDQTLPEVDGCKIIEYDHDGSHYFIRHDYTWNKNMKSHSTKSYISKDGKELNSNGNSGSFKEIIKIEFGIDQNFLRILRLGSNVTGVLTLKSTERKKFIASLREDTEIYLTIHKKLTEDFRTLNASINAVSNRLMQLSATDEDKMRSELNELQDDIESLLKKIKECESKIGKLQGVNQTLGKLSELTNQYHLTEATLENLRDQFEDLSHEVESANSSETLSSISNKIGKIQGSINTLEEKLLKDEDELTQTQTDINKFNDIILMSENNSHLDDMKSTLKDLERDYQNYTIKLSGFKCQYSYHFLATFIDDLSVLQNMIDEISQYNPNSIKTIYMKLNQNIGSWINQKINILSAQRTNVQKAMNTIEFSKEYTAPIPLFRAPFCPTKECPYYRSHPEVIKERSGNKKDINAKLSRMKDEITRLDAEISKYQEYPILQKKLQLLQNQWKSAIEVLGNLGVIDHSVSLLDILTDQMSRRDWYHYNQLIDILEKCKMQDEYQSITSRYVAVKNEISLLESPEYESSKYKREIALKRKSEVTEDMNTCNTEINRLKDQLSQLEDLYHIIQNKDENVKRLDSVKGDIQKCKESLDTLNKSIKKIEFNNDQITDLQIKLDKYTNEYTEKTAKVDKLKATLSQIEYNQDEYKNLMEERTTMKAILEAVSSKEGIPLILVKVFLDNCKEIINELIADVFEDDLEILDFNISETDFKIPYMINGQVVDDIEYASQGNYGPIYSVMSMCFQVNCR